jgi:hypothetical protein
VVAGFSRSPVGAVGANNQQQAALDARGSIERLP